MDFSHRTVRFFLTEQFNTEISQWALFSNQSPYSIYLRNQLPGKFPNTASDAYFSSSKSVLPILSLSYQKNPKLSKPELVSSYLHGPMSCYPETYSQPFCHLLFLKFLNLLQLWFFLFCTPFYHALLSILLII